MAHWILWNVEEKRKELQMKSAISWTQQQVTSIFHQSDIKLTVSICAATNDDIVNGVKSNVHYWNELLILKICQKSRTNSSKRKGRQRELHYPASFCGAPIGQIGPMGYVALLTPRRIRRAPSRQEDGGSQDAVESVVTFNDQRFLRVRLCVVFPHRGDREEMFHRGNPRRDDDHRWAPPEVSS